MSTRRRRVRLHAIVTSALVIALAVPYGGALAQTLDLSQALITSDALGDGWAIAQQGADKSIDINQPQVAPADGYAGFWKNGAGVVQVFLYEYPDRATTLAAFNNDKQDQWGHFTTQFTPVTGHGDGPAYQPVGLPGKGPGTSGLAFVDGNVIVYVSDDSIDNQADADALVAQAASAQDAALQGN